MKKFGFKLIKEEQIKEVQGVGTLWEHEKSGAKLFHIQCDDDNKVFSVSFRTPPKDDAGLPHILEHSVLCGSRKFPLKEPFVELVKGSLNTFLNAMTFPDKTMYPVASRNEQDFRNLMDVYLDAVFYPNIYGNPWTLRQEGWHYELADLDSELTYNGVVYNEMKGVFSSPDAILEQKVLSALFPDTPYGKESGGDPDAIPELTQAQFEEYHRTYYHPANSYFYLYGDMNLEEQLQFIDEEYLSHFDRIQVDSQISLQKAFMAPVEDKVSYPAAVGEEGQEKALLSLNWAIDTHDSFVTMGLEVLCHVLLETSASPLKRALQEAGLAREISGDFQDGILQPIFSVVGTYGDEGRKEEFSQTILTTLANLAQTGIDPKLIAGSLHRYEFQLREGVTGSTPKGLIYGIRAMNSWLYDGSPADSLTYEEQLNHLKKGATEGLFESLIEKYLLKNTHRALVVATPEAGLAEKRDQAMADKLQEWKKEQSKETLEKIIGETKELHRRQSEVDSEESLETIPLLKRSDLTQEADFPKWQETKRENGIVQLSQELFTSRILYLTLAFDGAVISDEEVPYVHLLTGLLARMNTSQYKYEDLSNEVNLCSGGLSFNLYAWGDKESSEAYYPKLTVKTKALTEDIPQLTQLIEEILLHTDFSDSRRLKELVSEGRARLENSINEAGQSIAVGRLNAILSTQGAYNYLSQLPFHEFIQELDENFDARKDETIQKLKALCQRIFSSQNLVISQVGSKDELASWGKSLNHLLEKLPKIGGNKLQYIAPERVEREGIYTSSKVQYVAQGFNYRSLGESFQGFYRIVETLLRYDYLWTRIRVQGGAYGASTRFERGGSLIFSSYRDPNLEETLEVYQGLGEYLRTFNPSEREMTKYIIGTMSNLDTPLTPSMKGELALSACLSRVTREDVQRERQQVLNATGADIQGIASWIQKGIQENKYCVFGGEDKIKKQEIIFDKISPAISTE